MNIITLTKKRQKKLNFRQNIFIYIFKLFFLKPIIKLDYLNNFFLHIQDTLKPRV
jgi:hypothetical protein